MSDKLGKIFFPLILLAAVILFFNPFLTGEKIPYIGDFTGSDLLELNLPFRFLASQSLVQGQVPFWTNFLSNGFPVLAEGQAGIFYPFNLILFSILPFPLAINYSYVVIFFLAGLFTYLYARSLNISQWGSILAALSFAFSGFFVFRMKHLNLINAAIWLPLIFYLIEKYFTVKKREVILILIALVYSVQLLAGFPPPVYISLVAGGLYFSLKYFFSQGISSRIIVQKIILPWLVVGLVIFGLTAFQLLPTLSFSASTGRSLTQPYSQVTDFPYPGSNLFYFVFPYALGNPAQGGYNRDLQQFGVFWENNIYFGIIPLLLAILAMVFVFPKNRHVKILTILFLISWMFVFGDSSPLFILFWQILPGFQMFRFPQRFLLITLLCSTVLAGFGFDYLFEKVQEYFRKTNKVIKSKMLFSSLLPLAIIIIVLLDLFSVAFKYVGILDYNEYFTPPKSVEYLKKDSDIFRIYSMNWPGVWQKVNELAGGWQNKLSLQISARELLPPNANVFWGIASAQDRASLEGGMLSREAHVLSNSLASASWFQKKDNGMIKIGDQALKVFGMNNVKYFLSYDDLESGHLSLEEEIRTPFFSPLKIYKNNLFLPFAFGVFEVQEVDDIQAMLPVLFQPGFDPARQIILEKGVSQTVVVGDSARASAEVVNYQDQLIVVEADFSQSGHLFFSQTYSSDWAATVDGQPVKINRANYAFSSVEVPVGKHVVKLYYDSLTFKTGKIISLTTLALVVLLLILLLAFKIKIKFLNS